MKTKRNRTIINIALTFFLICGITVISMAAINNLYTNVIPLAENQQGIKEESGAGEGLLISTSEREATVTTNEVLDDDGNVIEVHAEVLSAGTALGNLDVDPDVTGTYYLFARNSVSSSSGYGQFRGLFATSTSHYTISLTDGEVPDASSISAYSCIINNSDEEAYSTVPF